MFFSLLSSIINTKQSQSQNDEQLDSSAKIKRKPDVNAQFHNDRKNCVSLPTL